MNYALAAKTNASTIPEKKNGSSTIHSGNRSQNENKDGGRCIVPPFTPNTKADCSPKKEDRWASDSHGAIKSPISRLATGALTNDDVRSSLSDDQDYDDTESYPSSKVFGNGSMEKKRELPAFFKPGPWVDAALSMLLESPPHAAPEHIDERKDDERHNGHACAHFDNAATQDPEDIRQSLEPSKSMRELTKLHILSISPTVDVCDYVYLLPRSWMSEWLQWAAYYHLQNQATLRQRRKPWRTPAQQQFFSQLSKEISGRRENDEVVTEKPSADDDTIEDSNDVLSQACRTLDFDYDSIVNSRIKSLSEPPPLPGPIDPRSLSQMKKRNKPLLLQSNIIVGRGSLQTPPLEDERPRITCCAVAESFYKHLKSLHGVVCVDGDVIFSQPVKQSQIGIESSAAPHLSEVQQTNATTLRTVDSTETPSSMCGTLPDIASWATNGVISGPKYLPQPQPSENAAIKSSEATQKSMEWNPSRNSETSCVIHHHLHSSPSQDSIPSKSSGVPDGARHAVEFRRRVLLDFVNPKLTQHCVEVYPVAVHYQIIGSSDQKAGTSMSSGEEIVRKKKGHFLVSRETLMTQAIKSVLASVCPTVPSLRKRCWVQYSLPGSQTYENDDVKTRRDKYGTASSLSDGYELWTDVVTSSTKSSSFTVAEYLKSYVPGVTSISVGMTPTTQLHFHVLIETKPPPQPDVTSANQSPSLPFTARTKHELAWRIKVGDFVDAQDSAGNWYEAIVREVREQNIRVHFLGWSSRWDVSLPRVATYMKHKKRLPAPLPAKSPTPSRPWSNVLKNNGSRGGKTVAHNRREDQGANAATLAAKTAQLNNEMEMLAVRIPAPPAPLWSRTNQWRYCLKVGDRVEVRQVASLVKRPKWFSGTVLAFRDGPECDKPLTGGATLETLEEDENDKTNKVPLRLLHRKTQVLVEVMQEKAEILRKEQEKAASATGEEVQPDPAFMSKFDLDSGAVENNVVEQGFRTKPLADANPLPEADAGEIVLHSNIEKNSENETEGTTTPLIPNPPHIRWVYLYGEEICEMYTHNERPKLIRPKAASEMDLQYGPSSRSRGQHFSALSKGGNTLGEPYAPGCVGLQNLGNSCYMNSILQCLNHIPRLTTYFINGSYMQDLNSSNPLGSGGKVASAYAQHVTEVWSGDFQVLSPRNLKMTVGFFAPQFNNTYQHDSQEFLSFLMDGLHEDLNRIQDKPYVEDLEGSSDMKDEDVALESWRRHLLRHDSVMVDFCQGMHRSHLTCPECHYESVKFDVYSTISLPVPAQLDEMDFSKTAVPLEDCLSAFTSEEELDEENAWYCNKCKKHVCAKKHISLWSTPDVLVFHLKRFQYENHSRIRTRLLKTKIDTPVEYPTSVLDMSPYLMGPVDPDSPPYYNLIAVSEHAGRTANSGHYTATARSSNDQQWYKFNDSHVRDTTERAAVGDGTAAYVLFYLRSKGSSRWAGMERFLELRGADPHGALDSDLDGFHTVKSKKKGKRN